MELRALKRGFAICCLTTLIGCTAVQSERVMEQEATPDGIPYFLPKRPFVITVSTPVNDGPPTISIASGAAEPDLSQRFVISQGTNWIANNQFNVSVAPNGLLESSDSSATSEVAATVQSVAADAGLMTGPIPISAPVAPNAAARIGTTAASAPVLQAQTPLTTDLVPAVLSSVSETAADTPANGPKYACPQPGFYYQIVVYPEKRYDDQHPLTLCGNDANYDPHPHVVRWRRVDGHRGIFGKDNLNLARETKVSGLFFRHEIPYVVTVENDVPSGGGKSKSYYQIASPDESETDFFPVRRAFFANNTANITVTNGVITGVDQTTGSEVANFVGLPATWIGSYTSAVGQLFTGLTTISSDRQKLAQQLQATAATQAQGAAAARAQNAACRATIAQYDFSTMAPNAIPAAQAAVKAAC